MSLVILHVDSFYIPQLCKFFFSSLPFWPGKSHTAPRSLCDLEGHIDHGTVLQLVAHHLGQQGAHVAGDLRRRKDFGDGNRDEIPSATHTMDLDWKLWKFRQV